MTRGTSRRPLAIAGLALTMTAALSVGVAGHSPTHDSCRPDRFRSWRTPRPVRRTRRSSRCSRPPRPAQASSSSSRTAHPATRAGPSWPACRRTSSPSRCGRTSTRLVEPGIVAADWDDERPQGHRPRQRRRLRRPPRQPQEHPDLGRPHPRRRHGHHPQPVHVRWRAVEHPGRLPAPDQGRQDRGGGASPTSPSCISTSRSRTRAPARRWRPSSAGQGDVLHRRMRTRRSSRSRRASRIDYVMPEATRCSSRTPSRSPSTAMRSAPAKAFVDFLYTPEAQTIFGQKGYRPGRARGRSRSSRLRRARRSCSPSRTWAAGPRPGRGSSTRTPASWPRSSRELGRSRRGMSGMRRPADRPAGRHLPLRRPGPPGPRHRRVLPGPASSSSRIAAVLWRSVSDGLDAFIDGHHQPPGASPRSS